MMDRQTLGKLNEFLSIKGTRYLYFHRDADGVCSAALLSKFYPKFNIITKKGPRLTKEALEALIKKRPDLLVFVDLPVDQEWKALQRFQEEVPHAKIVIIDHHIFEKNMNSESIIHINPLFKESVYKSTSYIVYDIMRKLFGNKVRRFVWIAMMGAIGDYDLKDSKKLVDECEKSYPHLVGNDPHNSELSRGAKLLGSVITLKNWRGAMEALEILSGAESYEDFSSKKELKSCEREVDREFKRVIETAEREVIPEHSLVIYTIKTDLSMVSTASNHLSEKFPDKIIIVRKRSDSEWKISVRYQAGKINLGSILKKATAGIGTGGGHPKAAAGLTDDWKTFKERFIRELKAK